LGVSTVWICLIFSELYMERSSILQHATLPGLRPAARDRYGREIKIYEQFDPRESGINIKPPDSDEDPWAPKTSTDEEAADQYTMPSGYTAKEDKIDVEGLSKEEIKVKEAQRDKDFMMEMRNEARLKLEHKQRLRRRIIAEKMKKLEKIKAEEDEKESDRKKTISSLNATSAVLHVLKIGGKGDPCRIFLLPQPTKDQKWSVTPETISKHFKRLSLLVHPDKHKADPSTRLLAEKAFKILRAMQEKLLNMRKKALKIDEKKVEEERIEQKTAIVNDLNRQIDEYNYQKKKSEAHVSFVDKDGVRTVGGNAPTTAEILEARRRIRYEEELEAAGIERQEFGSWGYETNQEIEARIKDKLQEGSQVGDTAQDAYGYYDWEEKEGEPEGGIWVWKEGLPPEGAGDTQMGDETGGAMQEEETQMPSKRNSNPSPSNDALRMRFDRNPFEESLIPPESRPFGLGGISVSNRDNDDGEEIPEDVREAASRVRMRYWRKAVNQ